MGLVSGHLQRSAGARLGARQGEQGQDGQEMKEGYAPSCPLPNVRFCSLLARPRLRRQRLHQSLSCGRCCCWSGPIPVATASWCPACAGTQWTQGSLSQVSDSFRMRCSGRWVRAFNAAHHMSRSVIQGMGRRNVRQVPVLVQFVVRVFHCVLRRLL